MSRLNWYLFHMAASNQIFMLKIFFFSSSMICFSPALFYDYIKLGVGFHQSESKY